MAAKEGMSGGEAVAYITEGQWIDPIWALLHETLDENTAGLDLVASTELRPDLSLAAEAMTDRDYVDGHPIVRVSFGMAAWTVELAHTITPFLVSPDNSRPLVVDANGHIEWATPGIDLKKVARRLAYSLSWLTSRANHPYALAKAPLSPVQENYAAALATGAVFFAIAHEMAHVRLGEIRREPDPERSRAREYAADCWALKRIIALDEQRKDWSLNLTLPAIGIFFCSNAFRDGFANVEATPEATHPGSIERLLALNEQLDGLDDDESRFLFAGVAKVFEALRPCVQALSPYQLAPPGELRRVLAQAIPEVPDAIGQDIVLTWHCTYGLAVEGFLQYLASASNGPLSAERIAPIESWLESAPGSVIDALGAAYDGTLEPTNDPSGPLIHSVVRKMLPLLSPYVREAIVPG